MKLSVKYRDRNRRHARKIEDFAAAGVRSITRPRTYGSVIIYSNHHRPTIALIRDFYLGAERSTDVHRSRARRMGGLAVGGMATYVAIDRRDAHRRLPPHSASPTRVHRKHELSEWAALPRIHRSYRGLSCNAIRKVSTRIRSTPGLRPGFLRAIIRALAPASLGTRGAKAEATLPSRQSAEGSSRNKIYARPSGGRTLLHCATKRRITSARRRTAAPPSHRLRASDAYLVHQDRWLQLQPKLRNRRLAALGSSHSA